MKKFFKYVLILFTVTIIVFVALFKGKISFYIDVGKKYYQLKDNMPSTAEGINSKYVKNIDFKDVVYKNTSGVPLTLDIYKAKKKLPKGSPVILYVHGGSWVYGDKSLPSTIGPLLDLLSEEGYTIISTSYELMRTEMNFDKQISDVKDTIRWINKNKDVYGFNADEIGVLGISSGAQLSLLASYSSDKDFKGDPNLSNYPSKVKYVIDFSGPTYLSSLNMSNATWDLKNIIKSTKNKNDIFNKYSPVNFVKGDIPKTLIIHSMSDKVVTYKNATALYEKCKNNGTYVKLIPLKSSGHDFSNMTQEDLVALSTGLLRFIVSNSPF